MKYVLPRRGGVELTVSLFDEEEEKRQAGAAMRKKVSLKCRMRRCHWCARDEDEKIMEAQFDVKSERGGCCIRESKESFNFQTWRVVGARPLRGAHSKSRAIVCFSSGRAAVRRAHGTAHPSSPRGEGREEGHVPSRIQRGALGPTPPPTPGEDTIITTNANHPLPGGGGGGLGNKIYHFPREPPSLSGALTHYCRSSLRP